MNIDILRSDFLNKCDINAYRKELQEILASLRSEVQRATLKETELGNNINNIIQTLEQYYDKTEINELLEGLRIVVADIVEENNSNPVSSQAVYAALQDRVMFVNIMPLVALDDISGKIGTSSKSPSEIKEAIVSRKLVIIKQVDQFYTALHINDTGVNILVMNTEGNLSVLTINNNKEVYKKDISMDIDTELNGESNNPLANSVIYRTIQALKDDKEILKFNGILTDSITIVDGTSESAGGIYYSEKNKMFVRDSGLAGEQYFRNWDAFGEYKASSVYNTNSILNKDKLYAIVTDKLDLYMYSSQEGKLVNINNSIIKEINNVKTTLSNTSSIQASITNVRPDVEDENLYVGSCALGASTLKDYFDLGRPIFLYEEQLVLGGVQITDVVGDHVGGAGIIGNNLYLINVYDPTELLDYNVYIRLIPINASTESRTIIADIMSDHVPSNTTEDSNRYAIVKELSGDYYIYKWVRDDHQTYDQGWTGTWVKLTDALANNRLVIYDGVIYLYLDKLLRQLTRDTNDFTNIISNYPYLLPFNGFLTEEEDSRTPNVTTIYAGTSGNPVLILFGPNNKFVLKAYEPLALGNINGYKYYKSWAATDYRQASTSYRLKENVIYYQIVDNTIEAYLYIDGELIPFSGGNSNKLPNIQLLHYSFYGRPTTDLVNGYYDITENGRHLDEYKNGTWIRHTADTLAPTYFLGENTLVKWEDGVLTDVVYPITPEFLDFDVLPFSTFKTDRVSTTILTEPTNGNVVFNTTMHQFLLEYLVGDDEYGYASEWPDYSALNIIGSRHYNLVNGTIRTDALFINLSVKESEYKTAFYISNGSDLIEHKANTDNVVNIKYWSTSESILNDLSTRYVDLDYIYTEDTHKLFKYIGSGLVNVTPIKECIYIYLTNMYKWNGTLMVLLNSNSITPFIKILASGFTEPPTTPALGNGYYIYLNDDEVPAIFRYSNIGWTEFTDNAYVLWDGVLWLFSGGQLQETGISFGGGSTVTNLKLKSTNGTLEVSKALQSGNNNSNEIDIDPLLAPLVNSVQNLENAINTPETSETTDIFVTKRTATQSHFLFEDNPIVEEKIRLIQQAHANSIESIVTTEKVVIPEGTILTNATFEANKEYIIQGAVKLQTDINIPECVLNFEEQSGSFVLDDGVSKVNIVATDTAIIAGEDQQIFPKCTYNANGVVTAGIDFTGSHFNIDFARPEWFGAKQLTKAYYNRDLICFNNPVKIDSNYCVVKDLYIHAHVSEPKAYLVHNMEFNTSENPFMTLISWNRIYLYKPDARTEFFIFDYHGNYYALWKNSEYYNNYGENLEITAKQEVVKAMRPDGLPRYYGGVITEPVELITFVTPNTSLNPNYSDVSDDVNVVSKIKIYREVQAASTTYTDKQGNVGTKYNFEYQEISNGYVYQYLTTSGPRIITLADADFNELTFTDTGIYAYPVGYNGRGKSNISTMFKVGTALPRGLMTVDEVIDKYENPTNYKLYNLGHPYVSHDVYYDSINNRFLLCDPFNVDSNGKAIFYTLWENSNVWNTTLGTARTDVLFTNVSHDYVDAQTMEQAYARKLYEQDLKPRTTYISNRSTLIPLLNKLAEEGNEGATTCFRQAFEIGNGNVTLKKNGKYWVSNLIYKQGDDTFIYNGNNSTIFCWTNSGDVTLSFAIGDSVMYRNNANLNISVPIVRPMLRSTSGAVYINAKSSLHVSTVALEHATNGVIKDLNFVTLKDKSINGSDAEEFSYASMVSTGEWRENASSSGRHLFDIGDASYNVIIQNIKSANFRCLYQIKSSQNTLAACSDEIYFDKIIHDRAEMGTVPRNVINVYHSSMQLGMDALNGPSGDHFIYGLTLFKHMHYYNCHFYKTDDHNGVGVTFHGAANSSSQKTSQDKSYVVFDKCTFEAQRMFNGGQIYDFQFLNSKIYQLSNYMLVGNSNGYDCFYMTNDSGMFNRIAMSRVSLKNCDIHLDKSPLFFATPSGHNVLSYIDNCTIYSNMENKPALGEFNGEVRITNSKIEAPKAGVLIDNYNASAGFPARTSITVEGCNIRCKHNVVQDGADEPTKYKIINIRNNYITFTQQEGDTAAHYTTGGGNYGSRNVSSVVYFRKSSIAYKVLFENNTIEEYRAASTSERKETNDAPFKWVILGIGSGDYDNTAVFKGFNISPTSSHNPTEGLEEVLYASVLELIVVVKSIDNTTGTRTYWEPMNGLSYEAFSVGEIDPLNPISN